MKKISGKRRNELVKSYIQKVKYLQDKKYYKTNKVSCAAWDSWAATGKAGSCSICHIGYYNYTLHNKRSTTTKNYGLFSHKHSNWAFQEYGKFCCECYNEILKQCNYEFKQY